MSSVRENFSGIISINTFKDGEDIFQKLSNSSTSEEEILTDGYVGSNKKRSFLKYRKRHLGKQTSHRSLKYVPSRTMEYVPKKSRTSEDRQFVTKVSTSNGITYIKTKKVSSNKFPHSIFGAEVDTKSQRNLSLKEPYSNTYFHKITAKLSSHNYKASLQVDFLKNSNYQNRDKFSRKESDEYWSQLQNETKKVKISPNEKNVTLQTTMKRTQSSCFDYFDLLMDKEIRSHDPSQLIENDGSLSSGQRANVGKDLTAMNIDNRNTRKSSKSSCFNKIPEHKHFLNHDKSVVSQRSSQIYKNTVPVDYINHAMSSKIRDTFNSKVTNENGCEYFNEMSLMNRKLGSSCERLPNESNNVEINSNKTNITASPWSMENTASELDHLDLMELLDEENFSNDPAKLIENNVILSNGKSFNEEKQLETINIDKRNTRPKNFADNQNCSKLPKILSKRHVLNLEKDILTTRTQPSANIYEDTVHSGIPKNSNSQNRDTFNPNRKDKCGLKFFDEKSPIIGKVGSTPAQFSNEHENVEIISNKNNSTFSQTSMNDESWNGIDCFDTTKLMDVENLFYDPTVKGVSFSNETNKDDWFKTTNIDNRNTGPKTSSDGQKYSKSHSYLNKLDKNSPYLEKDVSVPTKAPSNEAKHLEFVTIDKTDPQCNTDADSQESFNSLNCINKVLKEGNFLYLLDEDTDLLENIPDHLATITSHIEESHCAQTTNADSWQETQTGTNSQLFCELDNSPLVTLLENSGRSLESSQRNDVNFISQLFFNDLDTPDKKKENIFEDKFMEIILESLSGTAQNNHFVDHMSAFLNLLDKATDEINSTEEDEPYIPSPVIWYTSRNFDDTLSTGSVENFTEAEKKLRQGLNTITMDKSLVCKDDGNVQFVCSRDKRIIVINKIIDLFLKILEDVRQGKSPSFRVRNRCDWSNSIFVDDRLMLKPIGEASMRTIVYNKKNCKSNFKIILFLLVKIVKLLANNSTCTKREIYYQLVKYIDKQSKVDSAINTVSCMLQEAPWNLGILTTSKGLVYGDLTIFVGDDEVIHCNVTGGCLIPQNISEITKIQSDAFFILVIEKDSIFQELLVNDLPNKLTRPFIMITGKGFSDAHTRLFIKKLCTIMLIPVFLLTDSDPYGVEIMLTYRFGSLKLSHLHDQLAIPNLRWIGVHPSDIINMKLAKLPLMPTDVAKINNILKRPYISSYPRIGHELQVLLEGNAKAEIEALFKSDNFLQDVYLPAKFLTLDYI